MKEKSSRGMKRGSRLASAALLGALVACGSSGSSNTNGTAGGASSSTPGSSSGGADAAAPAAPATSGDPCAALIAFDQRCSDTAEVRSQACADARKSTCDGVTRVMGTAYRAAVVVCFTGTIGCDDTDACVTDQFSTVTPTAAMMKVRDDYCATCGTEVGPTCKDDFYRMSKEDGNGDGYTIMQVADDVAATIDAKCTGAALKPADFGATTCRDGFLYCAISEQESAGPGLPDVCYPPAPPEPDAGGD